MVRMMSEITIDNITISGFRAFLEAQTFTLRQNQRAKSLAIFAPNAKGKSSLIDAIEFFFSEDGTLKRLGRIRSGTQAGRQALENVNAQERGIPSEVTMNFHDSDSGGFGNTRVITQSDHYRPAEAERVVQMRELDFIIRGPDLRRFVEGQSPQERYQEVSKWFELVALTNIQNNLRDLRLRLNRELVEDAATDERLRDLVKATSGFLTVWDENEVLTWINSNILEPLKSEIRLTALDKSDDNYVIIVELKDDEEKYIGLTTWRQVEENLIATYEKDVEKPDGSILDLGDIISFESAVETLITAKETEQRERAKSEKAVFKQVWEEAKMVFEDEDVRIDVCPICATPLERTSEGSRDHVLVHLRSEIESLGLYHKAAKKLDEAIRKVKEQQTSLRSSLNSLHSTLKAANLEEDAKTVEEYVGVLDSWKEEQEQPDLLTLKETISTLYQNVKVEIKRIIKSQGEYTYVNALSKINELIEIKVKLGEIQETRRELQKLHGTLSEYESLLNSKIRDYIQTFIDGLKSDINTLYQSVHPEEESAPNIRLELPTDTRQAYIDLLVDFAPNRQGVIPSGYLSDSQVHTLALSLRLAAMKRFNLEVPIIVLDDVVTSYDADHRKAIARMIALHLSGFQIIIVTHDERFFAYLKDHLPESSWVFKRIMKLDPNFGPIFHDHQISDKLVEEVLARGDTAANDIRQAEEEWLVRICREFGVNIRIREVHHPYDYSRNELAIALHKFLKDKRIEVPTVSGISNPFLISLQSGVVENFGSHFSDNPYAFGSVGDEIVRWGEFKEFRGYFVCECGRKRFKRPEGMDRPVCKRCETTFSFRL